MNADDDQRITQTIRNMQIIAAALLMGMVSFLGLVLFLFSGRNQAQPAELPILSLVSVAMLVVTVPVSLLLPRAMIRNGVRQLGGQPNPVLSKLLALRQTALIVGLALLEGTGFTALLAMLIEFHPVAMAVVAVALTLMLLQFPTQAKIRAWLEQQQAWLEEMSLGRE